VPMLVSDLLARLDLRLKLLVEGDLSQTIRWVHASELPDPAPYLRGGEVVLSAGVWYAGPESVERFVGGLARSGAAALGFSPYEQLPTIPPEVVEAAQRHGITLFEVPENVPFIVVTEAFVEASMASRERPLRESASRNAELVRGLQGGQGLDALLRVLTRVMPGSAAVIVDRRVVTRIGPRPIPPEVLAAIASGAEGAVADAGFLVYQIPAGPAAATLVVQTQGELPSIDQSAAVDQVLAFLAIELQRLRSIRENARRYATELFDLVDEGVREHAATVARMRSLGLSPTETMVVACVEGPDQERALRLVERWLDQREGVNVAGIKTGQVLALLPVSPDADVAQLAADLYGALGDAHLVGFGSVAAGAPSVRESLIEARHAARFAARRRDVGYATHDELASHAVLLATQPDHELLRFEQALLRPLVEHDARRNSDLVPTLDKFLSTTGQYKVTAEDLHVHVNTLRLRLARVEELTGRDLARMDDRVDFWLALRARDLREDRVGRGSD